MPSYPTSVVSFTTHNPGDTIASADINSIQTEVAAIEAGITQGSAPLNSSNSTVANLSVTGGSTLNTLTITGTLTLSTNVTVAGKVFSSNNYVYVRAGATQAISTNAFTGINFDTEILNSGSMHSTASNSSRITFESTGVYFISAMVNWGTLGSSGLVGAKLTLNDVTDISAADWTPKASVGAAGFGGCSKPSALYRITSTADYVTVRAYQNTNGSVNVPASTAMVDSVTLLAHRIAK